MTADGPIPADVASLVAPLVLFSALLNAVWNALLKWRVPSAGAGAAASAPATGGDATIATLGWVMGFGGLVTLAAIPFGPIPGNTVWPYLAATAVLQTAYALFLAAAYRHGDLSQAYPIARGGAALFVAALSWLVAGETLEAREWVGIGIAVLGIASLAFDGGRRVDPRRLGYPLAAGAFTAAYTLVDGLGARTHGHAFSYFVWMNVVTAPWILLYGFATRGKAFAADMHALRREGLAATLIAMTSYGIAIWALSLGKMGKVAVLRETSVVFAAILGALFLKEPFGARRLLAAILVAAGLAIARG